MDDLSFGDSKWEKPSTISEEIWEISLKELCVMWEGLFPENMFTNLSLYNVILSSTLA